MTIDKQLGSDARDPAPPGQTPVGRLSGGQQAQLALTLIEGGCLLALALLLCAATVWLVHRRAT